MEYLNPFYNGCWLPRHVKNSSILKMATLANILISRYEVVETRLHQLSGNKRFNSHKTVVPFIRNPKNVQKVCIPESKIQQCNCHCSSPRQRKKQSQGRL